MRPKHALSLARAVYVCVRARVLGVGGGSVSRVCVSVPRLHSPLHLLLGCRCRHHPLLCPARSVLRCLLLLLLLLCLQLLLLLRVRLRPL